MPPVPPTLNDFEQGDEIAWGSLATIMEVKYKKNNKCYALKILNKAEVMKKKAVRSVTLEKDALVKLGKQPEQHPGLVRLHHCFQDNINLYFVLDLADNGDLKAQTQDRGSLSLACARYYTAQLVDAVQFLHRSGVVHRDIKPENILLDKDNRSKLADFGCAYNGTDMETPRTNTFVGTAAYISPELLSRSEANPTSPDIWAIGCTLFFFLFGASPFLAATEYLSMKRVKSLDYSIPSGCDKDAADLIKRLLVLEPSDRIGVSPKSTPKALCQHPFFVGPGTSPPSSDVGDSGSVIDWDSLWTVPAPKITAGSYRPSPSRTNVETGEIWTDFENVRISND